LGVETIWNFKFYSKNMFVSENTWG
jgi:hypothetical protein